MIQCILLRQHATVIIVCVFKIADAFGVCAGNNSLIRIIFVCERITVYVLDGSKQIITVGENRFSPRIIIYAYNLAGRILFEIHFLSGHTVGNGNQGIRIGDDCFEPLMVLDFCDVSFCIVIFGLCSIAVENIRILTRAIDC